MAQSVSLIGNGYLGQAYAEVFPEALIYDEPKEIIKTVQNIVGKHPSYIREDEAEGAITMISAFLGKDKKTGDE